LNPIRRNAGCLEGTFFSGLHSEFQTCYSYRKWYGHVTSVGSLFHLIWLVPVYITALYMHYDLETEWLKSLPWSGSLACIKHFKIADLFWVSRYMSTWFQRSSLRWLTLILGIVYSTVTQDKTVK
jgi:hypothetical protein